MIGSCNIDWCGGFGYTLRLLWPFLHKTSISKFELHKTHVNDFYTLCFLRTEVVRGGSMQLNHSELEYKYHTHPLSTQKLVHSNLSSILYKSHSIIPLSCSNISSFTHLALYISSLCSPTCCSKISYFPSCLALCLVFSPYLELVEEFLLFP